MSDKGRDRAIKLVVVEASVDFTKHTLLLSAHEHDQERQRKQDNCNRPDKVVSAVNCPIEVGIVPFSWLLSKRLLNSHSTNTAVISTRPRTERTAQTLSLVLQGRH